MMKTVISILFLCFTQIALANKIYWVSDLDNAFQVAKAQNKLIIVDFYADWCGPCKKMDMDVWDHQNVTAMSDKFVFAKIDIDRETTIARRYNVSSIPLVQIMDAGGETLVEMTGYRDEPFVASLLKAMPTNWEGIYQQETEIAKTAPTPEKLMELAKSYQDLAEGAMDNRVTVDALVGRSESYMQKAKKLSNKNAILEQEIELLGVLNDAYRGRGKRCKKLLDKMPLSSIEKDNLSLLYYVQAVVSMQNKDKKEAQIALNHLNETDKGSAYIEKAEQYRSHIEN